MKLYEILSTKKGVYAGYNLSKESSEELLDWARSGNIKNIYHPDKMHVTLAYSKKPFPFTPKGDLKTPLKCKIIKPDWLGDDNKTLVLLLDCPELKKRFKETIDAGAHTDYPNYKPHITISTDPEIDNINKLPKTNFSISLIHEYSQPLEPAKNWKDNVETIDESR